MAVTIQFPPLLLLFLLSSYFIHQSCCQLTPQNIQVFYPFPLPPPPLPHPPPPSPLPPPPPLLPPPTDTTTPTPTPVFTSPPSSSSNKTVAKAVAATAASTLVLSGLLFLLFVKYRHYRKEKEKEKGKEIPDLQGGNDNRNTIDPVLMMDNQFTRFEGIKGVIVDEEGLDVLYWKNLDDDDDHGNKRTVFKKELLRITEKEEEKRMTGVDFGGRKSKKFDGQIQEVPLLRGKSSGSHVWPTGEEIQSQKDFPPVVNQEILVRSQTSSRSPPPTPPSPPLPPPPPPPPLVVEKKSHVPLPPPLLLPKTGSSTSSSKPPPPPEVKFKPLHWDKVNANVGHPTAWDQLHNGSFR